MPARRNGDQFVLLEYFGIKMLGLNNTFREPDLNQALHQLMLDGLGIGNLQEKFDVGMQPMELAEYLWQQVSANGRARSHCQPTPFEAAKFLNSPGRFFFQRSHALSILCQN